MIKIVLGAVILGSVVAVAAAIKLNLVPKPNFSLAFVTSKLKTTAPSTKSLDELSLSPTVGESKELSVPEPSPAAGKVAGISTEKIGAVGKTISEKGSGVASALSSLVTSDGEKTQVTIDVQKISDQIGSQMEKLPAELVQKAKVAYCEQVLTEATRSATQ